MDVSLQFEHHYEVNQLLEIPGMPGKTRKFFYPGASVKSGKDGILLRIVPINGEPWIGCFAPGHSTHNFANRVMSCPNPKEICVVTSGAGYIVRADDPSNWKSVRAIPVCEARVSTEKRLLLFSDFTKLVAYGLNGLAWESPKASSDGIRITGVESGHIDLIGWDAAQRRETRVSVSLEDGTILSRAAR